MPGIELVVTVCLLAQPSVCEERHFPFFNESSLFTCMVRAQPYLADWALSNRRWTVKTWTCRDLKDQEWEA